MKVQAIDCHESQVEDWRIAIKNMPDLLARAYARESYIPISGGTRRLGPTGLLAIRPLLKSSRRDLWHLYMLAEAGPARRSPGVR